MINPDIKSTLSRLINIDSAYRSTITANNTADSFVFELSEPLLNVVSLSLYSLEVPQSWYTISQTKGTSNFIFYLLDSTQTSTTYIPITYKLLITIPDGNYTTEHFCNAVLTAITEALLANNITDISLDTFTNSFDHNKGIFTFKFTSTNPNYVIQFIWYDIKNTYTEMVNNIQL